MNTEIKEFLSGIRLSTLLIVPYWVVTGLIDYYVPQALDTRDYVNITANLVIVIYFASPIYLLIKKARFAAVGALVGGAVTIIACFFIGAMVSCGQGVCF